MLLYAKDLALHGALHMVCRKKFKHLVALAAVIFWGPFFCPHKEKRKKQSGLARLIRTVMYEYLRAIRTVILSHRCSPGGHQRSKIAYEITGPAPF